MKKITKKIYNRIIALLLIPVTALPLITGCGTDNTLSSNNISTNQIDTDALADIISSSIDDYVEADPVTISTNWEDYEGNVDTLVYGLLENEYSMAYDVFNAEIILPDGTQIYGLAYTDYQYYFEEDETTGFFPAGFIGYIGEESVPEDLIEDGLEIYNMDYQDDNYSFVLAYDTEDYLEHCVVWGQYLKYGVSEGVITYEVTEYSQDICDDTLGALYSYDDEKYLYDPNIGNYSYIAGDSLFSSIDFDQLEEDVNTILENQDEYLAQVDIENAVYLAQETVNAFFLSKQNETFMGYDVSELIALAEEIDPMQCIQITDDGMILIDLQDSPPTKKDELVKWVTGITCGVIIIGSFAATAFAPALAPVSGAICGAASEVFLEVMFQNQTLENVNWLKVGVCSVSGALFAWACPMLAGAASKTTVTGVVSLFGKNIDPKNLYNLGIMAGNAMLTISNSIVGGATSAAFAYIDGQSNDEIIDAFLLGAALSGALTMLAMGASSIVQRGSIAISNKTSNNWLSKISNSITEYIGENQVKIFTDEIESILRPKSVYAATRAAILEATGVAYIDDVTMKMMIAQLVSKKNDNFALFDMNNNPVSKEELFKLGGNGIIKIKETCTDPKILQFFSDLNVTEIKIVNGIPDLKELALDKFVYTITPNRSANMGEYKKYLANFWSENPDKIPQLIKEAILNEAGVSTIEEVTLTATKVGDAMSACSLTFHEGADGVVYIIDTYIHSKISHYGGVAYASIVQEVQIGMAHFEDLLKTQPAAITGTLIATEG